MSNINCTDFNRLLAEAVESRLPVDTAELRGHAAQCAECKATWLDAVLLDSAVAQWRNTKRVASPVDLADIVLFRKTAAEEAAISVARVGAPPSNTTRPRRWLSRNTAAASAIVVAAVVGAILLGGRLGDRLGRQGDATVAHTPVGFAPPRIAAADPHGLVQAQPVLAPPVQTSRVLSKPIAKPPVEAPVEAMVQDAQSAYFDLATEAAQAIAAASVLVPRPAPAAAPAANANDRWVDDVGREFEPVSKNLSQAFQFLLEAVPAEKAPAT